MSYPQVPRLSGQGAFALLPSPYNCDEKRSSAFLGGGSFGLLALGLLLWLRRLGTSGFGSRSFRGSGRGRRGAFGRRQLLLFGIHARSLALEIAEVEEPVAVHVALGQDLDALVTGAVQREDALHADAVG